MLRPEPKPERRKEEEQETTDYLARAPPGTQGRSGLASLPDRAPRLDEVRPRMDGRGKIASASARELTRGPGAPPRRRRPDFTGEGRRRRDGAPGRRGSSGGNARKTRERKTRSRSLGAKEKATDRSLENSSGRGASSDGRKREDSGPPRSTAVR